MPCPGSLGVLLLALALAACGESADDEYRDEFPTIAGWSCWRATWGRGLRSAGEADDSRLAAEFGTYARRLGGCERGSTIWIRPIAWRPSTPCSPRWARCAARSPT